jgi:hypothetical protein
LTTAQSESALTQIQPTPTCPPCTASPWLAIPCPSLLPLSSLSPFDPLAASLALVHFRLFSSSFVHFDPSLLLRRPPFVRARPAAFARLRPYFPLCLDPFTVWKPLWFVYLCALWLCTWRDLEPAAQHRCFRSKSDCETLALSNDQLTPQFTFYTHSLISIPL